MKELRYFGPPGTGKSSLLATEKIPAAAERFGPEKVIVTSFTRAAAREIATKKSRTTGSTIPIPHQNVGTLHSLCYRLLGRPELTVGHIDQWNEKHPGLTLTGKTGSESLDEGGVEELLSGMGDKVYNKLSIYRAKMLERRLWTPDVEVFSDKWEDWKAELGLMDFTDLIEKCLDTMPMAPGNPRVMFIDEAQDFVPLQLALIRSWGLHMDWHVLCGDDDQCIYHFTGASPDAFINPPIDNKFKLVLSQSHRVPLEVFERANRVIERVGIREPKIYQPRNAKGVVRNDMSSYASPESSVLEAIDIASSGQTVMILGSCAYMLDSIKRILLENAAPFHNPYRRRRGDWNPLAGSGNGVSARDLLLAFIGTGPDGEYWTIEQLYKWSRFIKVGREGLLRKRAAAIHKGMKEALERNDPGLHSSRHTVKEILSPDAIKPAMDRNVDWLFDNLKSARKKTIDFALRVYHQHGESGLDKVPNITIGTIHSVKGGEADVVYLMPDISFQAAEAMSRSGKETDAVHRLFYVGMTRAKNELILMSPKNHRNNTLYVDL